MHTPHHRPHLTDHTLTHTLTQPATHEDSQFEIFGLCGEQRWPRSNMTRTTCVGSTLTWTEQNDQKKMITLSVHQKEQHQQTERTRHLSKRTQHKETKHTQAVMTAD